MAEGQVGAGAAAVTGDGAGPAAGGRVGHDEVARADAVDDAVASVGTVVRTAAQLPPGGGQGAPAPIDVLDAVADAVDVLGVVAAVLSRPIGAARTAVVRQVVGAGVLAAVEAAAAARAHPEADPVLEPFADRCDDAADDLRRLLAVLTDAGGVAATSGAT